MEQIFLLFLILAEVQEWQHVRRRAKALQRPPETLQGEARDLIRGTYKLDGRLLLVLDTQQAIVSPEN